ncbi:toxin [Neorhizobium galegae]|uniref:Toxin n=1 Tax=Neorhizobium galegae TaxID=399 RepID=A0A6A1TTB1_NEOGA|nr:TfuA-like protein [Neorhizobium galegae]KAB1087265.1 toxin [Neorhizobium galegae]
MKVVFVGPSLGSSTRQMKQRFPSLTFRGPAARGDILKAVEDGATAIALIDGYFGESASVWHKEILYALSRDVSIGGGSSMGALRAAECEAFGMIGIGRIYSDYAAGRLIDDEAVALIHGPEELGWMPLSVPRVDYEATIRKLGRMGLISAAERQRFFLAANFMHYTERTYQAILERCEFSDPQRGAVILHDIKRHKVELKREDARAVLVWLNGITSSRKHSKWTFAQTAHWEKLRDEMDSAQGSMND